MSEMNANASAVLLLTGDSGSGKSSLIATLAKYVKRRYGKVTRLMTADGGGWPTEVDALIKLGLIQPWRLDSRYSVGGEGLLEETLHKAAQGYWPEAGALDYATGNALPACKLVAPIVTSYRFYCGAGHLLKEVPNPSGLQPIQCNACGKLITLAAGRVETAHSSPEGFAEVGAVAFEGITSWSEAQMASLADRRARQELHGEKSAIGGRFQSGDLFIDANNRADYGIAQTQAEKWIRSSRAIPGLVVPPVWTGLESRAEETGQMGVAWWPDIAGKAKGPKVPQWCGHWVGTQKVKGAEGKREYRLYLSDYEGIDGLPHKYRLRSAPKALPEYLSDGEGEEFSGFNLGTLFTLLEQAAEKSQERARAEFPDAPGVRQEEKNATLVEGSGDLGLGSAGAVRGGGNLGAHSSTAPTPATILKPPSLPGLKPPTVAPVKVTIGGVKR